MSVTRILIAFALLSSLTACGGIPIRSIPQLLTLQQQISDADPGEFMLAIQVDQQLVPPPNATPNLKVVFHPTESTAFAAVDKTLPMQFTVIEANSLGLPPPPSGRKWLIYQLTQESRQELRNVQAYFKSLKRQKLEGSLGLGIAQEGIAVRDPRFADSRWESWLRTSVRDGFFELWSGTVDDLLKLAEKKT